MTTADKDFTQLKEWIKQLKWKSVEKDNMEFEVRTTCFVRDELLRFADTTQTKEVGICPICEKPYPFTHR